MEDEGLEDGELLEPAPERKKTPRLVRFFKFMAQKGASDLHLKANRPPLLRVAGSLRPLDMEPLTAEQTERYIRAILTPDQEATLDEKGSVDFAYEFGENERVRVNAFYQRGALSLAARAVKNRIPDFQELNLPEAVEKLASFHQGLVLVCGVTGSGKSTTLAAVIERINQSRRCHILTIEDPIEYVYEDKKAAISQREMHIDVFSWSEALSAAVREDPDVILVGEMRDRETFAAALSAAETGHLVFGTLHASSAAQVFGRVLEMFPAEERDSVRQGLAFNLQAILCQKLAPSCLHGVAMAPAVELLFCTPTVRELIRKGQDKSIPDAIRAGEREGMQDFTRSLADLVSKGLITGETALEVAPNVDELKMALQGIRLSTKSLVR